MTHIAVLLGGESSEREVSLRTGGAVVEALKRLKYRVSEIDPGPDLPEKIRAAKPDVVFNALHGTYGEDGCIPGLLEVLHIPYTHSGVTASAMAMNKAIAKKLFAAGGIPVAGSKLVQRKDILDKEGHLRDVMTRPYVIKPVAEGSSVGVLIVIDDGLVTSAHPNFPKANDLMVEQYIAGRELTVAVLDGEAMGVLEIRPKEGFYDYANKYTAGKTEYIVPADIEKAVEEKAMLYAEQAHIMLGCRGVTRSDFRLDNHGNLYMLEINTHPGMTATSLVPKIAKFAGMEFDQLVEYLVQSATLDHEP